MNLQQESQNGVVIVTPNGRLDISSAKLVEDSLIGIIERGHVRLVLDLSQLDYISSAGLRTLLVVAKRVEGAKGKIGLAALKPNVREVLEVGGFDRIFAIHADRAAALAAV
ncbi:anti-sigma B factor antagonist/stage II sporulation protein AA (anti-sigma F factor antagonist) [Stella humosa]|uniref:Anti-sigma factor antagonist n=1 Tax=Stella humosa TaxID=94 RepID=A0A3N1M7R7_9PROT|nr:STAS domain-containing protein [Stella humosa]ROP99737.1 anti-sigma B factor antagonist/stage II sporulation protein AA (anti-sigma F factor antagonist) [Stella humosa]BBK31036.1 anti-sigma factor antagonist [Stella humosa]